MDIAGEGIASGFMYLVYHRMGKCQAGKYLTIMTGLGILTRDIYRNYPMVRK